MPRQAFRRHIRECLSVSVGADELLGPKGLAKKDRDYQEGCVECEPLPPQLLTDQDVGSQWLPDDLEQRALAMQSVCV